MKVLFILNTAPHGNEFTYNGAVLQLQPSASTIPSALT